MARNRGLNSAQVAFDYLHAIPIKQLAIKYDVDETSIYNALHKQNVRLRPAYSADPIVVKNYLRGQQLVQEMFTLLTGCIPNADFASEPIIFDPTDPDDPSYTGDDD